MEQITFVAIIIIALIPGGCQIISQLKSDRPNVVYLLADDMGMGES